MLWKTNGGFPDAFGRALMDYHQGKAEFYHIERDDNYIEASELGMYFTEYADWTSVERQAIEYAKTSRVLDVGCGAGRHALFLQNLGFDVVGMDISPLAIEVCRLRGLKQVLPLSIAKVGQLPSSSFDSIIMMCHNFGLFGALKLAKKLLRSFYAITSKSARVIVSTRNPYITYEITNGLIHKTYHERNINRGRMPGQIRFRIRYQNLINPWVDYLFVSEEEMGEILIDTGWSIEKVISEVDDTMRMKPTYIAILTKA